MVERSGSPGGRVAVVEDGGYRLDIGATVLTMRGILAGVFEAAGTSLEAHLELVPLDPMYRATFPGEDEILVRQGIPAMTEEIRTKCGAADAAGFERFCRWLTGLYQLEMPNFIDRNFDTPLDLAWPLGPLVRLLRTGALRRLASVVDEHFGDPRLRKLFSFQAMYAGLSPFDALAVYGVITYMDTVEGVYFPMGGMHAVGEALAAAAVGAGATVQYDTEVERVLRRPGAGGREGGGEVVGVRLASGEVLAADAVVANPDLPVAYRSLVPELPAPRIARRGEYSPSCALWVAGVRGGMPDGAAHHNIHFGGQWEEAFDALLAQGRRMPDPSILVTSHSFSDPSLAPPGCSTLYALEPTPNLSGRVDWMDERERTRASLIARLHSHGYPVDDIEVERFYDPTDWERMGMEQGTPFGLSHRFFQSGPFRPANVERRAPGLFFVGSSTVPGVGVPMVLLSGRLVADRVEGIRP
ncbi:MAG: Phytoene dehydrogenase [uncultured Acidimicrobiales bacterium]|uniref:Phytoene dehydrogenase n=1 Tax=uncultured Acidimicrobiales bacterium TaxID=310071 RepID=A0A6J4HDI0_9ACTN|nr:MAG: Phytoene dehydrogenase [uncultured Acidimicrobiales bacterium]